MTTSTVRRRERADLLRLGAFLTVAAVLTAYLVVVFGDLRGGSRESYSAVFDDVSGLEVGDQVRVASVTVGSVTDIDVRPDATVEVHFDVDDDLALNQATTATVTYRNLIGDRYVALDRRDPDAAILQPGQTIPVDRTAPALDLDLLLNGFKPLFAGLAPAQINEVSGQLVAVLQGQRSAVDSLVQTISTLAPAIADRQELVTQVLTNLDGVLTTVDRRRDTLGLLVTRLVTLTRGLARDDDGIYDAAAEVDRLAVRGADLLRGARADLNPDLVALATTLQQVNAHSDTLEQVITSMPDHYERVLDSASYGNFFNFFLCGVRIRLAGTDDAPVQAPWIRSDEERCSR